MADEPTHADKTVKAIEVEAWELAKRRAVQSGDSMAAWLARAIKNEAARQAGMQVQPPGETEVQPRETRANSAPRPYPDAVSAGDLADLIQAMAALAEVPIRDPRAHDAPGITAAQRASAMAAAGLKLREARGLPAPAQRGNSGGPRQRLLAGLPLKGNGMPAEET